MAIVTSPMVNPITVIPTELPADEATPIDGAAASPATIATIIQTLLLFILSFCDVSYAISFA